MKKILLLFLSLIISLIACHPDPLGERSPNVLILLADDQGWGDLSFNGNPYLSTPNIDALARGGATFNQFYVQPVCSPTRAELLTGRYHPRTGVRSTSAGGERIDLDEQLMSELFQEAGYQTACFGKWHSGGQHPYHPNSRGFDLFYGFTSGHWGHYFDPPLDHNGDIVRGQGYLPDDLTEHTMKFIGESEQPFFVYLAFNTPHSPMQVPDRWWSKFEKVTISEAPRDSSAQHHARAALAMVENIDWNVGRILETLEKTGQLENTIIFYMTDNGPNGIRWNGGLKGRKGSTDEGGVRSPLFVQWPDRISPGLVIEPISAAIDICPTLLDLCQIHPVGLTDFDGSSLAPLLLQHPVAWPERTLIQHWNGRTSVRTPQFRLDHEDRLYDLNADPLQLSDLSDSLISITEALKLDKKNWTENVLAELPATDTRPFTVGHPDFATDHLPARDGVPHGLVTRSNRYPNDSYFTNWKSISDSITWNIQILSKGEYELDIHYTCPDSSTGSGVLLTIGAQSVEFQVSEGYDTPLIGAEEDRVQRIESYVKDFQQLTAGKLFLEEGHQTLILSAKNIPKDYVMDLKQVTIRKIAPGS